MKNKLLLVPLLFAACGDNDNDGSTDECIVEDFAVGTDGHSQPLGSAAGEARAGRLSASDLPPTERGLLTWAANDFVLANDQVAMVIEDAGPSDLYDPWGGRPVGFAKIEGGALSQPGEFGELFFLTGRYSVVTESVSVIADGSDGGPAIVRALGNVSPTPAVDSVASSLFSQNFDGLRVAIDYSLAPGSETVQVTMRYLSRRPVPIQVVSTVHAFMYTPRSPVFVPGIGFGAEGRAGAWIGIVDQNGTSFSYSTTENFQAGLALNGFASNLSGGFEMAACGTTERPHASITIGGPGLDALRSAVARERGEAQRQISGTVTEEGGGPAAGVRVHATAMDGTYLTRSLTDSSGAYTLNVPADQAVELLAYRRGIPLVGPTAVGAGTATADLAMPAQAMIRVAVTQDGTSDPLPVRIQILPTTGDAPDVPDEYGETRVGTDRVHVEYAISGEVTVPVPPGTWRVVASRGYEYELIDTEVTVAAGDSVDVEGSLERSVDTTGVMCADFHIHTIRSADSGDDARVKLMSAVADGLEIPVRSEHEWVEDFEPLIADLGVDDWAFGIASVEMTSFEVWGHMGVFPLAPQAGEVNQGAPKWQTFASPETPDEPVVTLEAPSVFNQVRSRPEAPAIIINHPLGETNYFGYVGLDAATGTVEREADWDLDFRLIEVFNDSSWLDNLGGTVAHWFALLKTGRRVFAVGSSDSHRIVSSPVGYPRTCLEVGTDDPRSLTPALIRDTATAGASYISGGIYVDAEIAGAGPGQDADLDSSTATVSVVVQAATWVDVDNLQIMVDGVEAVNRAILPGDAEPGGVVRLRADIDVTVAAGSFVLVAVSGDTTLEPVHPGREPFGVTNPIFISNITP